MLNQAFLHQQNLLLTDHPCSEDHNPSSDHAHLRTYETWPGILDRASFDMVEHLLLFCQCTVCHLSVSPCSKGVDDLDSWYMCPNEPQSRYHGLYQCRIRYYDPDVAPLDHLAPEDAHSSQIQRFCRLRSWHPVC